jgi:MFS family permease
MALGWGSMSMLQAATTNFAGIMTLRFLVGAFEAGFVPAVALYMTFFYHRGEMGLRYGLFISFSPLASCFASALAYGLVHAKTSIHNWKLLFLVGKYCLGFVDNTVIGKDLSDKDSSGQRALPQFSSQSLPTSIYLPHRPNAASLPHDKTISSVSAPSGAEAKNKMGNSTSSKPLRLLVTTRTTCRP